jgi:AraC-like DNA-binding protein
MPAIFPTPTIIGYENNGKSIRPKNALLIGQHTVTNSRTVFKKFLSLQIVFQPGALYRLLAIPQHELTNQLLEAGDVLGNDIEFVNEQLYHAKDHHTMITVAEQFLTARLNRARKDMERIDLMAQQMLKPEHSLDWYVSNAFLCHRQFDRKFIDRVGISPKEYLRVVRFDQAYRMKNLYPKMPWFNIAIACGYFDYQHLSKDYQAFTGYTPSTFFAMESPERLLGTEEVY